VPRHVLFIPGERAPSTHWIGGWVGPEAGLDVVPKKKISFPCRDSNPGRAARRPSEYTDRATSAPLL
jgi:hypothetical protein